MLFRTLILLAAAVGLSAAELPAPEAFAGFRIGTDKKLVRWDRIVDYMRMADAASDRILVQELGKSTNGHPFLNVVVSAPETIESLDKYRDVQTDRQA